MRSERTYSFIAKVWSIVFAFVGLSFLFIPDRIAELLNGLADISGLSGTITAPSGNLWHVLTISLMGILAVTASLSAKNPKAKPYYLALVIAKSISVAGFIFLMLQDGPAWVICAGADAFVALTLMLTFPTPKTDMTPGFARTTNAKAPHY